MRYERIDAGASTPSGTFMPGDGRETRREINRLSFERSLVRKIVKHEVDGEINFTNPFCKKLETRESPVVDRKLPSGTTLGMRVGEERERIARILYVLPLLSPPDRSVFREDNRTTID